MGGGEVVKKGWLIKSPPLEGGGLKAWRKRFFMLRSSKVLEYYKSEDGELLKGVINLEDCRMVHSDLSHKKYKFVFDIETKERTYYLVAQSQEEMKGWVDVLCHMCGLVVQDVPEFLCTTEGDASVTSSSSSSSISGPNISSPIYSTTPATRPAAATGGGVAFNERFKPPEVQVTGMESMYSLALADPDVQRQLGREPEVQVPSGTLLSEALASKGLGSGVRTSSVSSASGGEANTSLSSDSASFLQPRHEPASATISNLYSSVPKKTAKGVAQGGMVRPVPKPRSATLNPTSADSMAEHSDPTSSHHLPGHTGTLPSQLAGRSDRAETREDGYMRPRPATRSNYDHLPPGLPRPALQQTLSGGVSPRQHRSALLKGSQSPGPASHTPSTPSSSSSSSSSPKPPTNPGYVNVRHQYLDGAPPPVDRASKPPEPSPPRVDRKLKPKSAAGSEGSDSSSGDSPPVYPARTSSLGVESTQVQVPPPRTTSLAPSLELSTSLCEGDMFMDSELPKPSTRTMQYTQVEFDQETGRPNMAAMSSINPQPAPSEREGSLSDLRSHPIPAPRRVNYSDIDLTATNAMAKKYKEPPQHQVSLGEAEKLALKEKPYINVKKEGGLDEDTDPGYYMHMRNLTYEEAMAMYDLSLTENIDVSSDEEVDS